MVRAHALLGEAAFIDQAEEGRFSTAGFDDPLEAVAMIVRRHPMRKDQIEATLDHFSSDDVAVALERLVQEEKLRAVPYQGEIYYTISQGRYHRPES